MTSLKDLYLSSRGGVRGGEERREIGGRSLVADDGKREGPVRSECGTFLSLAQSIVGGGYGGRVGTIFFKNSRLRMTGSAGTAEGSLSS